MIKGILILLNHGLHQDWEKKAKAEEQSLFGVTGREIVRIRCAKQEMIPVLTELFSMPKLWENSMIFECYQITFEKNF